MKKKRFCPDCKRVTEQTAKKYDPDDPDSFYVWTCTDCGESVDIVNEQIPEE